VSIKSPIPQAEEALKSSGWKLLAVPTPLSEKTPKPQEFREDALCYKKVAFSPVTEVISFTELYNSFPGSRPCTANS
jgi:hypothetical protein